jgi:hypothetical protein
MCDTIESASAANVSMSLTGPGMKDWASDHAKEFAAAVEQDISGHLQVEKKNIDLLDAGFRSSLLSALLDSSPSASPNTIVIHLGIGNKASNALTPVALGKKLELAINSGLANMTSLEVKCGFTVTAKILAVSAEQPANGFTLPVWAWIAIATGVFLCCGIFLCCNTCQHKRETSLTRRDSFAGASAKQYLSLHDGGREMSPFGRTTR